MIIRATLILALVLTACATTTAVSPTVEISSDKRIEEKALPPDPATEALPAGTPPGDWVEPAEKGITVPRSGLLVSEARAARDALYRIRYPELRRNFEADRMVWRAHRELYEERLKSADEALKKAEPNWFERHAFQLGVVGGFVLGAGTVVGLAYALGPATK